MPVEIEFFFDIVSPYSYLASTQMAGLATRSGAQVRWRPFLLGGVMKAVGNEPPGNLPPRAVYMLRDLQRWAAAYRVPFTWPHVFPLNTLATQRVLCSLEEAEVPALAARLFHAYWVDGMDLSQPAVLSGLVGIERMARSGDPANKARLLANTQEAVARGAFGAPTLFVGDQMFFGNDRLPFVEQAVRDLA